MTQKKRFWKTRGKCADRLPQPRASYVARHWHNDQPYVCRHRVSHPHVSTTCRGDCVSLGHRLKMSDFSHVRECMTINVFLLIYCRYIHMASKQDCDVLHHISYGVLICGGRDFHGERRVHFLGYLSRACASSLSIMPLSTATAYTIVSCQEIRRNSKHGVEHVRSTWEVDFLRRKNSCKQGAIQQGCAEIPAI